MKSIFFAKQGCLLHEDDRNRRRLLGVVPLSCLIFFNVSGSPLGSEQIVSSVGPLNALAATALFGVMFSLPQALICTELSTSFPENGGLVLWSQAAFGRYWAVQQSYWALFSGVVDLALYPVLFYRTVAYQFILGAEDSPSACIIPGNDLSNASTSGINSFYEYGGKLFALGAFGAPNFFSSELVGLGTTTFGLLTLAPFVLLVGLAVPRFAWHTLVAPPLQAVGDPSMLSVLPTLFWMLSGFDYGSSFAGEVCSEPLLYELFHGSRRLILFRAGGQSK